MMDLFKGQIPIKVNSSTIGDTIIAGFSAQGDAVSNELEIVGGSSYAENKQTGDIYGGNANSNKVISKDGGFSARYLWW